jgi:excisionase family DNA binding protein
MPSPPSGPLDEQLLRPREVADLFGVRTPTIARWARSGRLQPLLTLGGHRRYRWTDVRGLLDADETTPDQRQLEQDAVRLYQQGWSIRQVADRFGSAYGAMRRILMRRTALRSRGGAERLGPGVKHHPSRDRANDVCLVPPDA